SDTARFSSPPTRTPDNVTNSPARANLVHIIKPPLIMWTNKKRYRGFGTFSGTSPPSAPRPSAACSAVRPVLGRPPRARPSAARPAVRRVLGCSRRARQSGARAAVTAARWFEPRAEPARVSNISRVRRDELRALQAPLKERYRGEPE